MIEDERLVFYDVEVYKYDSLVVFKRIDKTEIAHYWNEDFDKIEDLIRGKIIVGYNNYYYDDKILYRMKNCAPQSEIKAMNDGLVIKEVLEVNEYGTELQKMRNLFSLFNTRSLDCFQQIDVARPGLKQIEGNMGISIEETTIPFDYPQKLTAAQREEVYRYCSHDVDATIDVFNLRRESYFNVKSSLIGLVPDDRKRKSMSYWGTNTISANVLLSKKTDNSNDTRAYATKTEKASCKRYIPSDKWRSVPELPSEIFDIWERWLTGEKMPPYKLRQYDCEFVFGVGGLHGTPLNNTIKYKNVKLLDVGSMYPSIIVNLSVLGSGKKLAENDPIETYDAMRKERLSIKKSDPTKANALKLVLNSVYGNLKYEHSMLYKPMASTAVCAYGQMALFDLCRRLYKAGYRLININTDGVAFDDPAGTHGDDYKTLWKDWEEEWSMYLELDEFTEWIQKDVNNYVAVKTNGKIKTKGGEVNKYAEDAYFKNNNIRIVQIGVVEGMLYKKEPEDVILEHLDDPHLFQYVLKAGRTYKGVCDSDRKMYQNVNRVFAVLPEYATPKLYKLRQDDGLVNFPNVPEYAKLWNADCKDYTNFKNEVDIGFYAEMIRRKISQWGINT